MHKQLIASTLLFMGVCAIFNSATKADETMFASMHTLQKEGRKLCMVGHFHYGSSTGLRTERIAIRAAIKSWEDFTSWEYGSDWGRFRRAANRGKKCERVAGKWSCSVEGRPCRR